MKKILVAVLITLVSVAAFADEVHKTVDVSQAGTLSNSISDSEKTTITNLTVTGQVNADDVALIKDMAKNGTLSQIDMSGATSATADVIGESSFERCTKLKSIALPQGITSIGTSAFNYCSALTSITIPDGVTAIGASAFSNCSYLTGITIPQSVTNIGASAFAICGELSSVTIPDGVTTISDYTFQNCSKLTSITIPEGVTYIGNAAFYKTGIASITIPRSVTSISSDAFAHCSQLTDVTILGKTLPTTNEYAFYKISSDATLHCAPLHGTTCSTTAPWKPFSTIDASLVVFASDERLADYVTDDCKYSVTMLRIYGEVNSSDITLMADMAKSGALSQIDMTGATAASADLIGESSFEKCKKLTSVIFPQGITSIGNSAFNGCSSLSSITIPDAVKSIGGRAFQGCESLTSITIPKKVTTINVNTFAGCSSLTSAELCSGITSICSEAFKGCSKLVSVNIPDGVTNLEESVFYGCSSLTSAVVPDGIRRIYGSLFYGCSSLASVTLGTGVTSIGSSAFYGCSSLPAITIPANVTVIGESAFQNCSSLTALSLPRKVSSISSKGFSGCTSLNELTIQGYTLPYSVADAFDGISSNATLYCKSALMQTCKTTAPWTSFANVVATDMAITLPQSGIIIACYNKPLDFTEVTGAKAYIAVGFNPANSRVLLQSVDHVPAGTGVVIKGTAGTYGVPETATGYTYVNLLVGTLEDITLSATDGSNTNYILARDATAGIGFYQVTDGYKLPANNAYLRIPTSSSGARTAIGLTFDGEDDTTDIIPVVNPSEPAEGNTGAIYNLQGQRMKTFTRGLNIVNGKKIFVK